MDNNVFRVYTFHNTVVCLNGKKHLRHVAAENMSDSHVPVYAQRDGEKLHLFFVENKRVRYIGNVIDSEHFDVSDKPIVNRIAANLDDGSIAVVQDGKYLSARQNIEVFSLAPRILAWEHIFLRKAEFTFSDLANSEQGKINIHQVEGGTMPNAVFRVYTIHKTEVCLDGKRQLRHIAIENMPVDYIPIYARRRDEELNLFFVENNQVKYIGNVIDSGHFDVSDEPIVNKIAADLDDGSIAVVQNGKYWSAARDPGTFVFAPRILAWEHFFLDKTEFTLDELTGSEQLTPEAPSTGSARSRYKVSIVIPLIDQSEPLAPTLESILSQTMDEYEVVVVDGRRAEGNPIADELVRKFSDRLSIVKAAQDVDALGAMYNIGINYAGGQYVFLIDSGDQLIESALDDLYTKAVNHRAEAIYCGAIDASKCELYDLAMRVHNFVNGRYGMNSNGRFLNREFLVTNRIEYPPVHAAEEAVFSFCLACQAKRYLIASDKVFRVRAEFKEISLKRSFFVATNEAFEAVDKVMLSLDFFNRRSEYRYVVLNVLNELCKKYLDRSQKSQYEFYEAVLAEVKANRAAFNRTAFLAFNFCKANYQYAQLLKKDRQINELNNEIKKVKEGA